MDLNHQPLRVGYVGGQPKRINERVVDGQWLQYLEAYTETVKIPPFRFIKLFGGSMNQWLQRFPQSLDELSVRLQELCVQYRMETIYVNLPTVIPYLLMARNHAGLNLGFLFLTHSVGSEFWLKQWIAIAPWITERDVLLTSTISSREALLHISERYQLAKHIPLCMDMQIPKQENEKDYNRKHKRILIMGRIEDVKNIELVIECFAAIRVELPELYLTIAGEYTGRSEEQMMAYKQAITDLIQRLDLASFIEFSGPVEGAAKDSLFHESDLLMNLSTDPGETFGYNLIEAKAWGLPVICAKWDGFQELIAHGVDGYFVDCNWEGELPVLNKQQIIRSCLHLLTNNTLLKAVSEQSLASAQPYDYRVVFPQIVAAVRDSQGHVVSASPDTAAIAMSPVAELSSIIRTEHLAKFPFYREPLFLIPGDANHVPYSQWMPQVKTIIYHFAGREEHAEL